MSFGHKEEGNLKYVQIVDGAFAVKVTEQEALNPDGTLKVNHRKRVNKKGDTVYEFVAHSVSGVIDRLQIRDSDFGPQVSLGVRFEDDTIAAIGFSLMNDDGSTLTTISSSLGDQIGLVDFSKPVKIGLSKSKEGKLRGIAFEQGGVYIPNSKENEKFASHISHRPQPVEKTSLTGEKKWDWSAPSEWQYNQIKKAIDRFVQEGVGNTTEAPAQGEFPTLEGNPDLPF